MDDRDLTAVLVAYLADIDSVPFAHEQVRIDMFSDCVDGGR